MSENGGPIPSMVANLLQACHYCCKDTIDLHLEKRRLSKCSKCKSDDWQYHKALCKALRAMTQDCDMKQIATDNLPPEILLPTTMGRMETHIMNKLSRENGLEELKFVREFLGRELTASEQNTVVWQPKCIGCGRTDRMIRAGAEVESAPAISVLFKVPRPKRHALKPCPKCETAFYCCEEHWKAAQAIHAIRPAEEGFDSGRTQCQLYEELRLDHSFMSTMTDGSGHLVWIPERIKQQWERLEVGQARKNWEKEFANELKDGLPSIAETKESEEMTLPPALRAISVGLSMPMTMLYALQHLNDDEEWTRKPELTIHVLGASGRKEVAAGIVFEEMLHRLPELEHLRSYALFAPAPPNFKPEYMDTCQECSSRKRARTHELHAMLYHEYVEMMGAQYVEPDLAIAFNTGVTFYDDDWKETIDLLVRRKIPSAFTAFNEEEARGEAELLKEAGATLIPEMGPIRNPWGSAQLAPDLFRLTGFYSDNRWLAGAFRG
ncbi:hypothetical protein V5O48_004995 [Marasmius crinis-equi]|uniref:Mitochondrial splicing suppressor 51-like C-terminal domain-containing protein n=1 Tax=Marasmius crinis-equi TaxID=585013 RepID=A0ABR3FNH8_9AGAR